MTNPFYIYILASQRNGTLYIGVTSNLIQRVWQHKSKAVEGFTKQYGVEQADVLRELRFLRGSDR